MLSMAVGRQQDELVHRRAISWIPDVFQRTGGREVRTQDLKQFRLEDMIEDALAMVIRSRG